MSIWLETVPEFFNMLPDGYLKVTFFLRVGDNMRASQQSLVLQVTSAGRPLGVPETSLPRDQGEAYTINADVLRARVSTITSEQIEGFLDIVTGDPSQTIVSIGSEALSSFLERELVARCRNVQTRTTLYKKVRLEFYLSKIATGTGNNATLKSLRNYNTFDLTLPASICGDIDSNSVPARGAIALNMYPGSPTENTANANIGRQQDKPGRFLIRGCAASAEEALRGTPVTQLSGFLKTGGLISPNSVWALVPVVEVMEDIWSVRASTSAGYVRLASQKGKNPSGSDLAEGGS